MHFNNSCKINIFHSCLLLELSRMGTYETYPYLKSHKNREPVQSQLMDSYSG